jgi:hypothetical protein
LSDLRFQLGYLAPQGLDDIGEIHCFVWRMAAPDCEELMLVGNCEVNIASDRHSAWIIFVEVYGETVALVVYEGAAEACGARLASGWRIE